MQSQTILFFFAWFGFCKHSRLNQLLIKINLTYCGKPFCFLWWNWFNLPLCVAQRRNVASSSILHHLRALKSCIWAHFPKPFCLVNAKSPQSLKWRLYQRKALQTKCSTDTTDDLFFISRSVCSCQGASETGGDSESESQAATTSGHSTPRHHLGGDGGNIQGGQEMAHLIHQWHIHVYT